MAGRGLHTLYISPLKALATDVARNLGSSRSPRWASPSAMRPARATRRRTGGSASCRDPPDILLTTPESLARLLSYPELPGGSSPACGRWCSTRSTRWPRASAAASWSLGLVRLRGLAPRAALRRAVGHGGAGRMCCCAGSPPIRSGRDRPGRRRVREAENDLLVPGRGMPWGGHIGAVLDPGRLPADRASRHDLGVRQHAGPGPSWCSPHSGASIRRPCPSPCITAASPSSNAVGSRRPWRKGCLRATSATSSLDLGIDWGDVDLVVHVGAPKGAARLMQRIGRANHRLDEPAGPCWSRPTASRCWNAWPRGDTIEVHELDGGWQRSGGGGLDVLAQHLIGVACSGPFEAGGLSRGGEALPLPIPASLAKELRCCRRARGDRRLRAQGLPALSPPRARDRRPVATCRRASCCASTG